MLVSTIFIFAQNNALDFDGTDDYVNAPDSPDWGFRSGNFTLELWAKLSGTPTNNNGLLSRSNGEINPATFDGWAVGIQGNSTINLLGGIPGGPDYEFNIASKDVTDLKWYHIAAKRSR